MFRRKRKDQSQGELRTEHEHVYGTTPDRQGRWACADCGAILPPPFGAETLAERVERLKQEDQARFDREGLPPYVLLPTPDGVRIVGIG